MKGFLIAVFCFLFTLSVHAHKGTDWRWDRQAFEYTQNALFLESLLDPLRRLGENLDSGSALDLENPPEIYLDVLVDQIFLKSKVSQFSGAEPVKIDDQSVFIHERGSEEGRRMARRFLTQEFEQLGFVVTGQDYGKGVNFIAERVGLDSSKFLILSSHIDSVNNAGANDDGTGTIATLAIARALAPLDLGFTLRIVGFDQEELGLKGSKKYVDAFMKQKGEQLIGDIQLEMMGTNSRRDGAFHIIDCDRSDSIGLTEKIMRAVQVLGLPLKKVPGCTEASDHAAFWKAGLPAVVISENFFGGDSDPCYHRRCDRFDERLNFEYMGSITSAVASAVAQMVEAR